MVRGLSLGVLVVAGVLQAGLAMAQELPPLDMTPPDHGERAAKGAHHKGKAAGAPAAGSSHLWSDLVHGSAEQRAMEQEDDANAHRRPTDHSKDDFFSDWKGLK